MKFNKLIPEFNVSNFELSLKFYTEILKFKIEYNREESKFAFLSFQGSQIMIEQTNNKWKTGSLEHPFGRGINFQIEVKNIDTIIKSLNKNKYPIFIKPEENWYRVGKKMMGNKEFLVKDPDGYLLRFSQDLGEKKL